MKRVLLILIDALTGPELNRHMMTGHYPNLERVRAAGQFYETCLSIFPSITHAALSSIITGKYPVDHGIVGSHWYDFDHDKVAYFSGSLPMVLQKGIGTFIREFLIELNHDYLAAPTLFSTLERAGYQTACLNFPVYHGDVAHTADMPFLLSLFPDMPARTTVYGPSELYLGDLVDSLSPQAGVRPRKTGLLHWYGFHDDNTVALLEQMAANDAFPDFTLAYFPENDEVSHKEGPVAAHQRLGYMDALLGKLFATYGGLEEFLDQFALIISGDHSQSATLPDVTEQAIDLAELLPAERLAEAGHPWDPHDTIMPCPNLRAAQLYFRELEPAGYTHIIAQLLADERLDQAIYRASLLDGGPGYVVQTASAKLHFWRDAESSVTDRYGNQWGWQGDLAAVDGSVEGKVISFGNYPNAFERIAGLLDSPNSAPLWLTAHIGYEIIVPHVKTYPGGGSHASLHRLDSQPPLLLAGVPAGVTVPAQPRIVDIAPLCQAILEQRELVTLPVATCS